jgi:hypothetical protein
MLFSFSPFRTLSSSSTLTSRLSLPSPSLAGRRHLVHCAECAFPYTRSGRIRATRAIYRYTMCTSDKRTRAHTIANHHAKRKRTEHKCKCDNIYNIIDLDCCWRAVTHASRPGCNNYNVQVVSLYLIALWRVGTNQRTPYARNTHTPFSGTRKIGKVRRPCSRKYIVR